jgi:hypothetical protein
MARAIGDQDVSIVDQQTQLALDAIESGDGQVWLAQGCPGDRESVDWIALAGLSGRPSSAGHELGRDAPDGLASLEQVRF